MYRYEIEVYFNNTLLPANRERAADWHPDRHSIRRIGRGYTPGDTLVRSEVTQIVTSPGTDDPKWELLQCERVFRTLNADDRPNGERERSLSVGDVVAIRPGSGSAYAPTRWYSCESLGWERIAPPRRENIHAH
jgi:hypothetical protein